MPLEIGDTIEAKYRIVKLLGEGGMGAVFEGENVRIRRRVAIKVLHAAIASDSEATQRFEREAQAAGRIGNDHILEVLDLGELPGGEHFMVMEYLDGEPLSERIRRFERLTPTQVVPLFRQLLEGLRAAHDAGIVHRDLKPDNIYVLTEKMGQKDFVKIIDFGISKFQPLHGEMKMTRTGTVMGTPYYMSPEQASGSKEADFRSDIYAVGVMLYEALSGIVPFDAPTFNQLLFRIVLSEPTPIRQLVPELDEAFASIVSKAMARDVERRFQSAEAFALALENWMTHGLAVTVPPVAPGDTYLPEGTQASGTPDPVMQRPAAGTPAQGSVDSMADSEEGPSLAEPAPEGAAPGQAPPPGGVTPPRATDEASGASVSSGTTGAWTHSHSSKGGHVAPAIIALVVGAVFLVGMVAVGWWLWSSNVTSAGPELAADGSADAGQSAATESAPPAVQREQGPTSATESPEDDEPPREVIEADAAPPEPAGSEASAAAAPAKPTATTTPSPAAATAPPRPAPATRAPRPATRPARPKPTRATRAPAPMDFGY